MIRLGSFKRFRFIDFLALFILAVLWSITTYLTDLFLRQNSFIFSLLITAVLIAIASFFVRKAGSGFLFYTLCSLITLPFSNLWLEGLDKIVAFIAAGIVFELAIFIFRIEFSNMHFGVILGTGLSMSSIPFVILMLAKTVEGIAFYASNLAIISFAIGIMGSIIGFLVWLSIKGSRWVIKFEYAV